MLRIAQNKRYEKTGKIRTVVEKLGQQDGKIRTFIILIGEIRTQVSF